MPRSLCLYCLVVLTSCFIGTAAVGQDLPQQLFFKRISSDIGLSQPTVNCIYRDSKGFTWFATEDGLNRYDGNEFRVYRHIPGDTTSISHNVIHFITEDDSSNLWIGTVDGLNHFNRATERFTTFNATHRRPGTIYLEACNDKKRNRLWLAAGIGGLRYFDHISKTIRDVVQQKLINKSVWSIEQTGDTLFIGTLGKGLLMLDLNNNTVTQLADSTANIRSLLVTPATLWFGTEGDGLGKLDRRTLQTRYYTRQNSAISSNNVWALAEDPMQNLWIGTDGGGLNILSPTQEFKTVLHSEFNERTISANTIRSLHIEPNGQTWVGTYNGGACLYGIPPVSFMLYKKEFDNEHSLLNNSVSALAEDTNGTLWIGTDGGGLHYLKDNIIQRYPLPPTYHDIKVIISLWVDHSGMWIGTFQHGLLHRDTNGRWKQYRHMANDKTSLSNNIVWSITRDYKGYLWVGTDHGINRLDPATGVFNNLTNPLPGKAHDIFHRAQVQSICEADDHTLWIGSYGTLVAWYPERDSVGEVRSHLPGIHNLRVKTLRDDAPYLWIGTYGNGLCRYDTRTQTLVAFDEPDGLPNNVVLAIEKEADGNLWLSTNKGLVHFDTKDTLFTVFDDSYGVQGVIFNRGASLRTHDDHFVFGGTKGFNIFKPDTFRYDLEALTVAFTDFQIANKSVTPGTPLLPRSISLTRAIDLPYKDSRLISLQFSSFEFLAPQRIHYSYRLNGFDTTWLPADKAHNITFTNLDPGHYTLEVRASYNGHTWAKPTALSITIHAPWWLSLYFKIGLIIVIITGTVSFYRYRLHWLQTKKKELEDIVNEQSIEIKQQNQHLAAQNEELIQQNEEVMTQKEMINEQNILLFETKQKLQDANESLEQQVQQRTETLNETIAQLNKTIKELDAFVYSASHDLVAPLKSVLGLVDLAQREKPPELLALYLGHIDMSIRKLENVILNMIQYSRNTRLQVEHEEININALLQECIADVKFMPGASEVTIHTQIPSDHIIHSDATRLKIVFGNLISNAIKYRDVRKEACLIQIRFEKGKTSWRLEITDNGIGIDKKYLSRVFEMFFRATDRAQGSGLGLYIVEETVNRLYGEIHVDSELGEWTKFIVTVPNEEGYRRHK